MKSYKLLLIAVTLFITSCSVLKTNNIKTMNIYDTGVIQTPVLVDLDVDEVKVTGKAEGDDDDLKLIKQNAILNALELSNADILVEPKFKTETYRGKTTVIVTGYPGVYKNFRPLTNDEILLFENGIIEDSEVQRVVVRKFK